jgi:hypothetical protein
VLIGEADIVRNLVEFVDNLVVVDDGRQVTLVDHFRTKGLQDSRGKHQFLFLILIEEDVGKRNFEVAQQISDYLTHSFEVVV